MTEDLFLEEFLTEDEVAVFKSYIVDIPATFPAFKIKQRRYPRYFNERSVVEICFDEFGQAGAKQP